VLVLLIFALLLLSSCNSDNRNKFIGGDLTVYYFDESEENIAKEIAFFWKENGLLTGKQQDLQVQKDNNRFTVSMIAADPESVKNMSIDEISVLSQLKKKLYLDVFNRKSFTLEICNNRFEAIYTVE